MTMTITCAALRAETETTTVDLTRWPLVLAPGETWEVRFTFDVSNQGTEPQAFTPAHLAAVLRHQAEELEQ